ncbi:MAG: hypothetical protein WC878_07490 [Candidatus Paceibacterota bacterium]|jgi:hypothetical protein
MENKETPKYIHTLKSEHLSKGIKPIIACVDTHENLKTLEDLKNSPDRPTNVDYYLKPKKMDEKGIKHAGFKTYLISPVNETNKFSEGFTECTGVVVAGVDKETGKNISFLSHEDPFHFLANPEKFLSDMQSSLEEMKSRCVPGTIDAIIAGGNYITEPRRTGRFAKQREAYRNSIALLARLMESVFGFEPVVIAGPKNVPGYGDYLFYDTENRRLHLFRPETGDTSTESYMPKDFAEQEKKWEKNIYDDDSPYEDPDDDMFTDG